MVQSIEDLNDFKRVTEGEKEGAIEKEQIKDGE